MAQNFLVSPGVNVTEYDITTIIPSVATTIGALAGVFRWGPIGNTVLTGSQQDIVNWFLPPTDFNAETFWTGANFLNYSTNLQIARAGNTTGNTVVFTDAAANCSNGNTVVNMTSTQGITTGQLLFYSNSTALVYAPGKEYTVESVNSSSVTLSGPASANVTGLQLVFRDNVLFSAVAQETFNPAINDWSEQVVENPTQYQSIKGQFDTSIQWIARYPGYAGNSLRVAICDSPSQFQSNIALVPNNFFQSNACLMTGNINSNTLTFTITPANTANATMVTAANNFAANIQSQFGNGDLIQVGNNGITGIQYLKITSISAVANNSNVFSFTVSTLTPIQLSTNVSQNTVSRWWEFYNLFNIAPSQTAYQLQHGNTSANDAMHVVVVDQNGVFKNTPGLVLETYNGLSRATDALQVDGGSNYYATVINQQSQYIWYAHDRTTAPSNTALLLTSSLAQHPYDVQLYGGTDGPNEQNVPLSVLTTAYSQFQSAEDITISLLLQGKARGSGIDSNTDLGNWLLNNIATQRKDCVTFISPDLSLVVNNTGFEATSLVAARNFMPSTSFGFLDSGYKYQYDPWGNVYRWIPLNGDIAGLAAQTDQQRAPWWSFAGFNRGQIQNLVKLSWNPKQADRDLLYSNGINPVVTFPGQGTILYGDKTLLSAPSAFNRINVRRLFIVLETAIKLASQYTLFEFNDDFTRAQFRAMVNPYLATVQGQRGIYDYLVVCDTTNNTPDIIDANQFVGDIYIKPARSINFIQLNFVAVATGVSFDEIVGQFGTSGVGTTVS